MPALTRRRYHERQDWYIYFGYGRVGTIHLGGSYLSSSGGTPGRASVGG
jgi:hypothetical protein